MDQATEKRKRLYNFDSDELFVPYATHEVVGQAQPARNCQKVTLITFFSSNASAHDMMKKSTIHEFVIPVFQVRCR